VDRDDRVEARPPTAANEQLLVVELLEVALDQPVKVTRLAGGMVELAVLVLGADPLEAVPAGAPLELPDARPDPEPAGDDVVEELLEVLPGALPPLPPAVEPAVPVEPPVVVPGEGLSAPVPVPAPVPGPLLVPVPAPGPPLGDAGVGPAPATPSEGKPPGPELTPVPPLVSLPIAPGPPPSRLVGAPDPPLGSSPLVPGAIGLVDEPPLIETLPAALAPAGLGWSAGAAPDPSMAPASVAGRAAVSKAAGAVGDVAPPARAGAWCAGR
jgi:hypothetical protein